MMHANKSQWQGFISTLRARGKHDAAESLEAGASTFTDADGQRWSVPTDWRAAKSAVKLVRMGPTALRESDFNDKNGDALARSIFAEDDDEPIRPMRTGDGDALARSIFAEDEQPKGAA